MNTVQFSQQWLLQTIKYFRAFGFFRKQSDKSDEELATAIISWRAEVSGEDLNPSSIFSDLIVLSFDEERIWWKDTEADVCSGTTVYVQTIKEWSAISRGTFLPENVREDWTTEEGPIELTFFHNSQAIKLTPQYLDDYIDLGLLMLINSLIRSSGIQFELYKPFDQTGFIVALTASEKRRLETERGWQFAK